MDEIVSAITGATGFTALFDSNASITSTILTVHVENDGTTTTADVATAINGVSNFFDADSDDGATVYRASDPSQTLTHTGAAGQAAVYSFDLEGDTITFEVSSNGAATGDGSAYNSVDVVVANDLSGGDTPSADYDEGVVVPTGVTANGENAGDATLTLVLDGPGNDIIVSAVSGSGATYNNVKVDLVDDPSINVDSADVSFDDPNNILTIKLNSGVTTAATILDAINGDGGYPGIAEFSAAEAGETPLDGTVTLYSVVQSFTRSGGTASSASIAPPEGNNDIVISAVEVGDETNDVWIIFEDGLEHAGDETASYPGGSTLTIKIKAGETTANDILRAINGEVRFDAYVNITGGTTLGNKTYRLTTPDLITLDTTDLNFEEGTGTYQHQSVRAATVHINSLTANTYNSGSKTLAADADGFLPDIDGVTLTVGDRILVQDQTNAGENGVYVVTSLVSGSSKWVLTRASDFDEVIDTADIPAQFAARLDTTSETTNDGTGTIDTARGETVGAFRKLDKINTVGGDADPNHLTVYDGFVYFAADDGVTGIELWRVNGLTGAVERMTDLNPGAFDSKPTALAIFKDKNNKEWLYFAADNGTGVKLWRTDGTGTPMTVSEVLNDVASFVEPSALEAEGSTLAVISEESGGSRILTLVDDSGNTQNVGQQVPISNASRLTDWNDTLVFVVRTGTGFNLQTTSAVLATSPDDIGNLTVVGEDLYFTEGTDTIKFYDLSETSVKSVGTYTGFGFGELTAVDGKLLYTVGTGSGDVLYVHDPTSTDDPILIKHLSGSAESLTDVDGELFFSLISSRGTQLWQSDGTAEKTLKVTYGADNQAIESPEDMVVLSNRLYFTTFNSDCLRSLWMSELDGSWSTGGLETFGIIQLPAMTVDVLSAEGDGVVTVADLTEEAVATLTTDTDPSAVDLTMVVRELLAKGQTWMTVRLQSQTPVTLQRAVIGDDDATGLKVTTGERAGVVADLYTVEGRLLIKGEGIIDLSRWPAGTYFLKVYDTSSSIGTEKVVDSENSEISDPTQITAVGDMAYFVRDHKLWRSSGISTAEVKVAGLPNESLADPDNLTSVGKTLFFTWDSDSDTLTELWKTEGVLAEKVADLTGDPDDSAAVADTLYFTIGSSLYTSDGDGVTPIKGLGSTNIEDPIGSGSLLFFQVDGKLWQSDGTGPGTHAVSTVDPGVTDSQDLVAMDGYLYYTVLEGSTVTLWKGDPQEGELVGAEPLKVDALASESAIKADFIGVLDDHLLFTVTTSGGVQLWISNGTGDALLGDETDGTYQIKDDIGGSADSRKIEDDLLHFTVKVSENTYQVWTTDGTAGATRQVIGDDPGVVVDVNDELPGTIDEMLDLRGTLYLLTETDHYSMLWKSDGSGLELVTTFDGKAYGLTAVCDTLYFAVQKADAVIEDNDTPEDNSDDYPRDAYALWKSDGTAVGNVKVKDITNINPGTIDNLTALGNELVFTVLSVEDPDYDYSLWITDGTDMGTVPIASASAGSWDYGTIATEKPKNFLTVGRTLFFVF